jgi:hypothetical protein
MKSLKASPGRKEGELSDTVLMLPSTTGSFDCAVTSLRGVTAPLRMTFLSFTFSREILFSTR